MDRSEPLRYSINDFLVWKERNELVLQPKFQRRKVWSPQARSYLIDTILRGLPIPKIYMRQQIDVGTRRTVREVVDGQQRIRAVFDYLDGEFAVSKIHNEEFGGLRFTELPEGTREDFLNYYFSVGMLIGATDEDVLGIFARLNSYTVTLNPQEKRNAKFFGQFKQVVYRIGYDYLTFWRNNRVFTEYGIARMSEAELASELVVAMLDGLQDRKKSLNQFYDRYDEEFPYAERIRREFGSTIDTISEIFGDKLSRTRFRKTPLFYSLFCVIYDAKFGLPGGLTQPYLFPAASRKQILDRLLHLDEVLAAREPPAEYAEFVTASRVSTNQLGPRQTRHAVIWNAIRPYLRPAPP